MTLLVEGSAHCLDGVLDVDWEISPVEDLWYARRAGQTGVSYQERAHALARNCLTRVDPAFPEKVHPGDILVGRQGVGWGHDHDHAVMALKGLGLGAVLCESTRQNFQRNCLHHGLPLVKVPDIFGHVQSGHRLQVHLREGWVRNLTSGAELRFRPYPEFLLEMLEAGGLYGRNPFP